MENTSSYYQRAEVHNNSLLEQLMDIIIFFFTSYNKCL